LEGKADFFFGIGRLVEDEWDAVDAETTVVGLLIYPAFTLGMLQDVADDEV